MLKFIINNKIVETEKSAGMILLDFIRNEEKLTGTKEACREGECGACSVLIGKLNESGKMEYKTCASCLLPIGDVKDCHIVTVEGLDMPDLTLVQRLIIENSASQCGFCTPGIVLSLTGYCFSSDNFDYEDAITALDGNICRCTGYAAIRNAAKALSDSLLNNKNSDKNKRLELLADMEIVPKYFFDIPEKIKSLKSRCNQDLNDDTAVVAGGTDLFVQKPDKLEDSKLYFMSGRSDLDYIKSDDSNLLIGGAVNLEEFRKSETVNKYFPQMKNIILLHSSTILRNKATIAGNIVNASPIGDMSIILLVLNAALVIECKSRGLREVKLSEFYKGYKKYDLIGCEIIREIKIPKPSQNFYFNFEKVSNRKILDIASVNSAVSIKFDGNNNMEDLKISAGGVAPIPLLLKGFDEFTGKKINSENIKKIAEFSVNQVAPIDDIRGSAKYKKLLLKQLILSHFEKF
ncbi:MAG TPA: FAD binding domain-containing protein [bacterium]|nr:FAD binding domain-containing protein [bacterium]